MNYNYIYIDSMLLFYHVYNSKEYKSFIEEKLVFKYAIRNFILKVEEIKNKYLDRDGKIFILFDNPTSRDSIQNNFYFHKRKTLYKKYKENRKTEAKEFYNSLDLIRYYYMINESLYNVLQITYLEADDFVKPLLEINDKERKQNHLMITNDSDWARYLSKNIHWCLFNEPEDADAFFMKKGYYPSEKNIILYKAIFGDSSDNIPSIAPNNENNFHEFLDLIKKIDDLDNIFDLIIKKEELKNSKVLSLINEYLNQFKINLQLVSELKIEADVLEKRIIKGRNSKTTIERLNKIFKLYEDKSKYVFGNLKSIRNDNLILKNGSTE